jgi:CTP synthase (UTP-ammonia lyase)
MTADSQGKKDDQVRITVNGNFVVLSDKHTTGEAIKQAAIAAGIGVQLDFVLSEVLPNGEQKIIPNDKHVTVKDGDEFWAIPGDDNS